MDGSWRRPAGWASSRSIVHGLAATRTISGIQPASTDSAAAAFEVLDTDNQLVRVRTSCLAPVTGPPGGANKRADKTGRERHRCRPECEYSLAAMLSSPSPHSGPRHRLRPTRLSDDP